ncbi:MULTISPECIES: TetR/AcrR family transcriptional regulator [Nostoc]|uniref:TetR/AcrR family transcriptional regulator n=1 Tax=Nostoc paludosum FACHB-159 TaxID=2692908 RepID=A0ABR8K7K9_9NOSO|nr:MULTISPECIES: TetR/AcrR family transcriptional regulator [Nostoc]MBD2679101.1 TetR/AcrR family transcriptional regulator [Nostoc sp. FACHB-857]MBD2735482.1 TetR/AcrR family transcriptional regulator [Nostoc paludosum FACHB-159]
MARTKASEIERYSSSDKIEKILQGSKQEFLAHGYAGASMDRVALAAGVSKATIYSHFQDKEGLFKGLIEQLARKRFELIFGAQPLEGEPNIVLPQLLAKALTQMLEDKEFQAFQRVLIGESARFPELAQILFRYIAKPGSEIISQYLASHSELNIPDPDAMVWVLMGSIVHLVIAQEIMHGKDILPMESDRLINSLTYLINQCGK